MMKIEILKMAANFKMAAKTRQISGEKNVMLCNGEPLPKFFPLCLKMLLKI